MLYNQRKKKNAFCIIVALTRNAILPVVLPFQHQHTAALVLGANLGQGGGLILGVLFLARSGVHRRP